MAITPDVDRYYRSPSRVSPRISRGPYGIPLILPGPTGTPIPRGGRRDPQKDRLMAELREHDKTLAARDPRLRRPATPPDPLSGLIDELLGLATGGFGASEADFRAQASAEAAAQFNPQIAAVQSAIANARTQAEYNRSGLESLYGALAASYPADIAATKQTYGRAVGREKEIAQESEESIAASYATSQQNLADVMRQLGIETAAADVLPELTEDQAMIQARALERSAAEQSAFGREQTATEAYYGQGPSLARMGSTQAQGALMFQLQQFVQEQEAQRAQLEAQRSLTESALFGQYQTSAAQQQQEAQRAQFDMIDAILGRQLDIGRFNLERERASQQPTGPESTYKGTSGAAQVLGEMVGPVRGRQLLSELLNFMSENSSRTLQQPNFQQSLPALRDYAEDLNLPSPDVNAMINALAAIYGQYR